MQIVGRKGKKWRRGEGRGEKGNSPFLRVLFSCFLFFFVCSRPKRPFPSFFEPHCENNAKCKVFVMKISLHSYANKSNSHMESFELSLAFIMRFTATQKWPIPARSNSEKRTNPHGNACYAATKILPYCFCYQEFANCSLQY